MVLLTALNEKKTVVMAADFIMNKNKATITRFIQRPDTF